MSLWLGHAGSVLIAAHKKLGENASLGHETREKQMQINATETFEKHPQQKPKAPTNSRKAHIAEQTREGTKRTNTEKGAGQQVSRFSPRLRSEMIQFLKQHRFQPLIDVNRAMV